MQQLEVSGNKIKLVVNKDFSVVVSTRDGRMLWQSSGSQGPVVVVCHGKETPRTFSLSDFTTVSTAPFRDQTRQGQALRLSGIKDTDVALEIVFALNPKTDEVLFQVAQVGGADMVVSVEHFYRFEKAVADGGYLVLPRGSGYLVPAECPEELPGAGHQGWNGLNNFMVGGCWTLPLFGMTKENGDAWCAIVESWWDCEVKEEHVPGRASALDFNWCATLGSLGYPRRLLLRFDHGLDHVAMAKIYREYAGKTGLLRTLKEKAVQTPAIRQYLEGILFRWPAWKAEDEAAVLEDIRQLRQTGMKVNFFFPKWSASGYSAERNTPTSANSLWQAALHPTPVPGGWPVLAALAKTAHELGCTTQGFTNMGSQVPEGVEYDEARWPVDDKGQKLATLSTHDAADRLRRMLDNFQARGLKLDVLYFDGYAAHTAPPEDFSPSHPVTRRQVFEGQNECFAETRRRGIIPGGELARFWCLADCDYFFFTDWSQDRLTNTFTKGATGPVGEPIPLFQLVFHDCYIAGFSGGGYALYSPGYDWWADRTPRLYELLFTAAPAYNWLPNGPVPIPDWDNEKTRRTLAWLKRWSVYYRAIATSEMVSHRFLSPDRRKQRIEFANGVAAEFDLTANCFRVIGLPGFSGEWEKPEEL